ncbi:molybdenum cofactor sulfurylase [Litoreibacter meonggei]|uniref:Molybdenum cofactor sulfurylase n=1 Tax=Litoreibacter meonggei TaxID=1049199 RepID=A0A497WRB5_9RHOB|nr:xanthine dehydrogenase accessory protein XdhC [Litoreibacter meonggei]RLJ59361.1 molybdenum cofactor sulfurylase [Litoreibacter meonggei]
MSFDAAGLRDALAEHGHVARVVIVAHQGSSPRETGASMLVWEGGQSGTIGGGALELEAARLALKRTTPTITRVPLGPSLGQCCGGAVTLATEVFTKMPDIETSFARRVDGDAAQPMAIARAIANTRNGSGEGLVFENGWLFEPVQPARTPLWVWGAGHVGRAIVSTLAPTQAFDITWIDSGPHRFPENQDIQSSVTELTAINIPDAAHCAPLEAHHLILTYSHAFDLELCHRLLSHGFATAGLIGSATKWTRFRSRLQALGHTDAQIARIRCPIGQPVLGKHPQAIAVGVASELLMSMQTETLGKDVAV